MLTSVGFKVSWCYCDFSELHIFFLDTSQRNSLYAAHIGAIVEVLAYPFITSDKCTFFSFSSPSLNGILLCRYDFFDTALDLVQEYASGWCFLGKHTYFSQWCLSLLCLRSAHRKSGRRPPPAGLDGFSVLGLVLGEKSLEALGQRFLTFVSGVLVGYWKNGLPPKIGRGKQRVMRSVRFCGAGPWVLWARAPS